MKHARRLDIGPHPRRPGRLMLSVTGEAMRRGLTCCGSVPTEVAPMCFDRAEAKAKGVGCVACLKHIDRVTEEKEKANG